MFNVSPKFPRVAVHPLALVYTSSIPAMFNSFLGTGALTMPVPRGAGISLMVTLPHFPVTYKRSKQNIIMCSIDLYNQIIIIQGRYKIFYFILQIKKLSIKIPTDKILPTYLLLKVHIICFSITLQGTVWGLPILLPQ